MGSGLRKLVGSKSFDEISADRVSSVKCAKRSRLFIRGPNQHRVSLDNNVNADCIDEIPPSSTVKAQKRLLFGRAPSTVEPNPHPFSGRETTGAVYQIQQHSSSQNIMPESAKRIPAKQSGTDTGESSSKLKAKDSQTMDDLSNIGLSGGDYSPISHTFFKHPICDGLPAQQVVQCSKGRPRFLKSTAA